MDILDFAIEACLMQEYNRKIYTIIYYSRKMSPAELNYDIYDKKLLAIVLVFDHWRIYTANAIQLDIYIDYKNLFSFTLTKELNR